MVCMVLENGMIILFNEPTDIGMIFHDMMLGKDDYQFKHWKHGNVVCSTRIEPPLHPEGPEKIVENFGINLNKMLKKVLMKKDLMNMLKM